jgi:CheY-like chemotaxis protein
MGRAEATNRGRNDEPDLSLMDLSKSDVDGIEVTKQDPRG